MEKVVAETEATRSRAIVRKLQRYLLFAAIGAGCVAVVAVVFSSFEAAGLLAPFGGVYGMVWVFSDNKDKAREQRDALKRAENVKKNPHFYANTSRSRRRSARVRAQTELRRH